MSTKNKKKNKEYLCFFCDFKCCYLSEWERHEQTDKHISNKENQQMSTKNKEKNKEKTKENDNIFSCVCGKKYKERTGLWKHKQKCNKNNLIDIEKIINDNFLDLLKQNQEFKDLINDQNKQIIEQNKQIIELSTNMNITNYNTINNKFNLNFFLNEKCKDALNISDFVNSLKLTLEDLENVGESGFVNGITRIFVNGLKQLDVCKRPIHCSDLKRETMYLKNENVWEKDNEDKENMKKVIKQIANKNIKKIYEWKDKYPDCKYSDSKKNDQYSRIIIESMGARTIEEDQLLYEKIIKNIAKETTIDKSK